MKFKLKKSMLLYITKNEVRQYKLLSCEVQVINQKR